MKEIWADINGFEGLYQVSSWGRVRNKYKILTPYMNKKGYLKIDLYSDNERCKCRVHRLVAETFIPNLNNLPEVNHIDGNKMNNSVTNLEWVSGVGNRQHDKLFEEKLIEAAKAISGHQ